jgi:Protein of unknown function (DUF1761)
MNYNRIALATVAAFLAYLGTGALIFGALPQLKEEFARFPDVYRPPAGQMSHMPLGMAAMLVAMLVLALLYARLNRSGAGLTDGAAFGAAIGVFAVGAFVVHNYVNLNIGVRLTLVSALAYLLEWTVVGIVIGLVYRPAR